MDNIDTIKELEELQSISCYNTLFDILAKYHETKDFRLKWFKENTKIHRLLFRYSLDKNLKILKWFKEINYTIEETTLEDIIIEDGINYLDEICRLDLDFKPVLGKLAVLNDRIKILKWMNEKKRSNKFRIWEDIIIEAAKLDRKKYIYMVGRQ
jgi:hypothetical protein